MKASSQKIADFDIKVVNFTKKIDEIALSIPNLPMSDVPVGEGLRQ